MKRGLWKQTLTEHSSPSWPCPSCARGSLKMVSKTLEKKETARSRRAHAHENWDPLDVEYTFTAWLQCGSCREDIVVAGVGGVEPGYDEEG